jgi:hypothetical protein
MHLIPCASLKVAARGCRPSSALVMRGRGASWRSSRCSLVEVNVHSELSKNGSAASVTVFAGSLFEVDVHSALSKRTY